MNEIERTANPTTEEAIKYLEGMIFTQDFSPATLRAVAVNTMAIDALREQAEREKLLQWLDDMDNPLEPIKIESALRSETMKLEFRKANRPKDVSILDYTIIAALAEALRQRLEVEP